MSRRGSVCLRGFARFLLLFLLVVACGVTGDAFRRKVSVELNPGLTPPITLPPGVALLHARALGPNDTLHFLFCNQGAPTLLLVLSNSIESEVRVDWPAFINTSSAHSLRVEPEHAVIYSRALVFTRLWEYSDVNDTADPSLVPPSRFFPPYELQNFTWSPVNESLESDHTITFCGRDESLSFTNASFCLQLSVFEVEGRDWLWPRLSHSANSSQLRVWLDGVGARDNHSRFSLELQDVSGAGPKGRVQERRSIDDEFTPSIFKVVQWVWPAGNGSRVTGYCQWKPVAYLSRSPALEEASPCSHSDPAPLTLPEPQSALTRGFFSAGTQTRGLNISYGISGGAFYTSYLSWTVLVGMGDPPVDSFSVLIIIIMVVGLGAPLLLIIVGGVYVFVRKRMSQPAEYGPIN